MTLSIITFNCVYWEKRQTYNRKLYITFTNPSFMIPIPFQYIRIK